MQLLSKIKIALAALAVFGAVSGSQAAVLEVRHTYKSPTGEFYADLGYANDDSYQGLVSLWNVKNLDDNSAFLAFCIEPFTPAQGSGYEYTASTFIDETIQELYDRHYANALQSKDQAVGFQLALWELVGGTPASEFTSTPGQSVALAMLADVMADPDPFTRNYTLTRWSNGQYQDVLQAMALPALTVPEPASAALMLGSLALMVMVSRRRKQAQ